MLPFDLHTHTQTHRHTQTQTDTHTHPSTYMNMYTQEKIYIIYLFKERTYMHMVERDKDIIF